MATKREQRDALVEEYLQDEAVQRGLPWATELATADRKRRLRETLKKVVGAPFGVQPTPETEVSARAKAKAAASQEKAATQLVAAIQKLKDLPTGEMSHEDKLKMKSTILREIATRAASLYSTYSSATTTTGGQRLSGTQALAKMTDSLLGEEKGRGRGGGKHDVATTKKALDRLLAGNTFTVDQVAEIIARAGTDHVDVLADYAQAEAEKIVRKPGVDSTREENAELVVHRNADAVRAQANVNATAHPISADEDGGAWEQASEDIRRGGTKSTKYTTIISGTKVPWTRPGYVAEGDLPEGASDVEYELSPDAEKALERTSLESIEGDLENVEEVLKSLHAASPEHFDAGVGRILREVYGGRKGETAEEVINRFVGLDEAGVLRSEAAGEGKLKRLDTLIAAATKQQLTPAQAMSLFQGSIADMAEREGDLPAIAASGGMAKLTRALVRSYRKGDRPSETVAAAEAEDVEIETPEAPVSATPTLDEARERARAQGEEDKGDILGTGVTESAFQALSPIERARREAVLQEGYPTETKQEGEIPEVPYAPRPYRSRQGKGIGRAEMPRRELPWATEDPDRALKRLLLEQRIREHEIEQMNLK